MSEQKQALIAKIASRHARVAVVGLGYVGLPLLADFAAAGFEVWGIDIDPQRIARVSRGEGDFGGVSPETLRTLPKGPVHLTTEYSAVGECDAILICVPTPLNKTRDPDVHHLIESAQSIVRHLRPASLICLESTTYPGTTSELLRPILEETGLKAGTDFFLAFSPERIDPGRVDLSLRQIPKVMGGFSASCLEVASRLYGMVFDQIVPVSSTESAEMVKLLENTFRAVNIALVNEVAIMCDKLGLDVWEVIEAASTKPFGFMKFSPGPGVGGHCIPLDPHYLSWKLRTLNYHARFIQLAGEINTQMPAYWVGKTQDALNLQGKSVRGSRVLILGVAYKKDVGDVRESPALDIIELLQEKGADVRYYDPHVSFVSRDGLEMAASTSWPQDLEEADCVVVVTDHTSFDWSEIKARARAVVDTRNVLGREVRMPVALKS